MTATLVLALALATQAPPIQAAAPPQAALAAEFQANIQKQVEKRRNARSRKARSQPFMPETGFVMGSGSGTSPSSSRDKDDKYGSSGGSARGLSGDSCV